MIVDQLYHCKEPSAVMTSSAMSNRCKNNCIQSSVYKEFSIAHKTDIMVKVLIKCMCELSIIGTNIKICWSESSSG